MPGNPGGGKENFSEDTAAGNPSGGTEEPQEESADDAEPADPSSDPNAALGEDPADDTRDDPDNADNSPADAEDSEDNLSGGAAQEDGGEEALLTEEVSGQLTLKTYAAAEGEISRAAWVQDLVETFGMSVESGNPPDNYYSDISSGDEYYDDILIAVEFGVIDLEAGSEFRPEEAAAREFAASTLNSCLGFQLEEKEYTFAEAEDVNYPDDIQVAINRKWFTLDDDNRFLPDQAITETEAAAMLKDAEELQTALTLDENHDNSYTIAKGVKEVPEGTDVSIDSEGTVTITNCPIEISAGDIFVVYSYNLPVAYKALTVDTDGTVTLITTTQDEDTEAAITDIDCEGSFEVKLEQFEGSSGTSYRVNDTVVTEGATAYSISYDKNTRTLTADKKITIADSVSSTVTCKISNLNVEYRAKTNDAYVRFYGDVELSDSVVFNALDSLDIPGTFELGRIPIAGVGEIVIAMEYTLSGEVAVIITGNLYAGFSYTSADGFRVLYNFTRKDFMYTADAKIKAGAEISLGVDLLSVVKGTVYANIGVQGGFGLKNYSSGTPATCVTLSGYLYAGVGASAKVGPKNFSKYKSIYSQSNSPVRVYYHYEDNKLVGKCTCGSTDNPTWLSYYTSSSSKYFNPSGISSYTLDGNTVTLYTYTTSTDDYGDTVATITGYNGSASVLSIPSELDGIKVVSIGNNAFKGKTSLRNVRIPDTVTSIGYYAFSGCTALETLVLSKNLTSLGGKAFGSCTSLTAVEIPKSLETGGSTPYGEATAAGAFYACSNLKDISFEDGTTRIATYLFRGCTGIEEIKIPDTVTVIENSSFYEAANLKKATIGNSVTAIENHAFYKCSALEEITIPNTVTSIGFYAFSGCTALNTLVLSKNLKTLGGKAFGSCTSLTAVEIPKSLETGGSTPYGEATAAGAFYACSNLKDISFEDGTTRIATYLFRGCTGIEEIEIPDTVTVIENGSFYEAVNLKKATIGNSVTAIENHAFYKCSALEEITIPNTVTSIGFYAFSGCTALKTLVLSTNLKTLGGKAFGSCTSLTAVEIPKSLESGGSYPYGETSPAGAFYACSNLKSVSFEEGTTRVADYLFRGCTGIEEIEIPDTVTVIESNAFYGATGLKDVVIGKGVSTIENYVFYGCSSLTSIEIPDSVTSMGTYLFYGCTSLASAKLPEGLKSISSNTFYNCGSLTTIKLPDTVETIDTYAFYGSGLTSIVLSESLLKINAYVFQNCASLTSIEIPAGVTTIGTYAFYNCDALTKAVIPDSVTSIGTYIFADCGALADVTLGTGLTVIPTYAFNLCQSLESIVLPYRITTVNANAFTNCTAFTYITIPRATTTISGSAFSYPTKMTVYGVSGTYAQTYAEEQGMTFVNREVKAESVSLNKTELTLVKGATETLIMSVTPSDFTDEVAWKSLGTSYVTVTDDGTVKGVAIGSAKVRVTVGETYAECLVSVVQPVTSISLNKTSLSMEAGETYQLTATANPTTAAERGISWSSADETVATVDENGMVTALAKGTAKITAAAIDGSGVTNSCTVTVTNTLYVAASVDDLQSPHNYDNDCTDMWVYTLDGADYLSVTFSAETKVEPDLDFLYLYDGDGNLIGKYTGTELASQTINIPGDTIKIRLESDGATNYYGFKVESVVKAVLEKPLQGISLDQEELTLLAGEKSSALILSYDPKDTTDGTAATWTSSNNSVATVDDEGIVTAVGHGEADITARVGGFTAVCKVTVNTNETYTVTFYADLGGENEAAYATIENVPDGSTVELPASPEKEGCTLKGWYTEKNGGGTRFTASTKVRGNLTLYACWSDKELQRPEKLAFTNVTTTMYVGNKQQLDVAVTKTRARDYVQLEYEIVSGEEYADLDKQTGMLTAKKLGLNNAAASVTVKVHAVKEDSSGKSLYWTTANGAELFASTKITIKNVAAPSGVKIPTANKGDDSMRITWNANTTGKSIKVYVADKTGVKAADFESYLAGTGMPAGVNIVSSDDTDKTIKINVNDRERYCNITGLKADTKYTVYVRNVCNTTATGGTVYAAGTAVNAATTKHQADQLALIYNKYNYGCGSTDAEINLTLDAKSKTMAFSAGMYYDGTADHQYVSSSCIKPTVKYSITDGSSIAAVNSGGKVTVKGKGFFVLQVLSTIPGAKPEPEEIKASVKVTVTAAAANLKKASAVSQTVTVGQPIALDSLVNLDIPGGAVLSLKQIGSGEEGDDSGEYLRADGNGKNIIGFQASGNKWKYVTVTAKTYDNFGKESDSRDFVVKIKVNALAKPGVPVISDKGAVSFRAAFTKSAYADDYTVELLNSKKAVLETHSLEDLNDNQDGSLSYVFKNLLSGTNYYVRVTAVYTDDVKGEKAESASVLSKAAKTTVQTVAASAEGDLEVFAFVNEKEIDVEEYTKNSSTFRAFGINVGNKASVGVEIGELMRSLESDTLTWKSSNTSIATVKANKSTYSAVVTAKKSGAAVITVTSKTTKQVVASFTVQVVGYGLSTKVDWEELLE